jgi:excisionase family DNA binding protein
MSQAADSRRLPPTSDAEKAAEASRHLARAMRDDTQLTLQIDGGVRLNLPKAANALLYRLMNEMAQGNSVNIVADHAELTTQEAADLINVSRPHLIRLLEEGKIPFHKVGSHRRIKVSDLALFRSNTEDERQRVMDELARQAQELEMGY